MEENIKIQELPAPNPDTSSYTRSEMVGVLKVLLQKNLSLEQAIALSFIHEWSPGFQRTLLRHLERTLHPQFKDIVQTIQGTSTTHTFRRRKNTEVEPG